MPLTNQYKINKLYTGNSDIITIRWKHQLNSWTNIIWLLTWPSIIIIIIITYMAALLQLGISALLQLGIS